MSALREIATKAGVSPILITPPPAAPTKSAVLGSLWEASDLDEITGTVRDIDPHAVDLRDGATSATGLLLADGVHPSAAGQIRILRTVITGLASCGG